MCKVVCMDWGGQNEDEIISIHVRYPNGRIDKIYVGIDEFEIMQYTGAQDKNGKEIYEGDIVSKQGAYILWYEVCGCWAFDFIDSEIPTPIFHNLDFNNKAEVIGNIHQNPELLEINPANNPFEQFPKG